MELPDKVNPGRWSETYKEKITKAKEEAKRYELIASGVRTAGKNALRNRKTIRPV